MARLILFGGAVLLLLGGVAGLHALCLPPEVLVAPGASEVRVVDVRWGRHAVSYRAPALPSVWMHVVSVRLEERGWLPVDRDNLYRRIHAYRHVAEFGPLTYIEQVELWDDRGMAHASLRSQVVFGWHPLGEGTPTLRAAH